MSSEEIQVPGITEPAESPQQPESEAQPAPETVPFQYRGEEKQISASNLDALAAELGTSRDAAVMWLQQGKDYGHLIQESRQRERDLAEREAQVNAYLQQIESQRTQTLQGQRPTTSPQGIPAGDDPIALLRWQAEQVASLREAQEEFRRDFAEERRQYQEAVQDQYREQQVQMADEAYNQVVSDWKQRYPKIAAPSHEEIVDEMIATGMAQNKRLSYAEGYRRAARNLRWDQVQEYAARQAVEKMREPKATVTLPGSGSAPKPPQEKPKTDVEQALAGMTMGDLREIIPDSRR